MYIFFWYVKKNWNYKKRKWKRSLEGTINLDPNQLELWAAEFEIFCPISFSFLTYFYWKENFGGVFFWVKKRWSALINEP